MPSSTLRLCVVAHWLLSVLVLFTLFTPLLASRPVAAAPTGRILYAKPVTDNPSKSGESWDEARGLQGVLSLSVAGDEIWVAAGVYYPGFAVSTFQLKNGVAIYGGFDGTESSREQRNFRTHVTVLSGDVDNNDTNKSATGVISHTTDIVGTNSFHVVIGDNTNSTAILDGFTITGGDAPASNNWYSSSGGGLTMVDGSATLANLIFSGNRASAYGGGIYLIDSSPNLTNVTFSANYAEFDGGGIYNTGSSPNLTNVTFSGNYAELDGGGIYNTGGVLTLTNVIFSGNGANSGGGMYNDGSSPTLTNVIFSGNWADSGGGMYNDGSSPTLTNVTFSGNQAVYGGGMSNAAGSPILTNVTFSGNQADDVGGGIYYEKSSPVFQNSIVWNNTPDNIYSPPNSDPPSNPTYRYSLVQELNPAGTGNLDGIDPANDPDFVRPVNCGSDGCTDDPATPPVDESANDDYGDLRLLPSSPVIDAGDNNADLDAGGPKTATIASIATDLAGQPRIVAVKVLPATVDMGAYEAAVVSPTAGAGGPYTVNEGGTLDLIGFGSNDDVGIVNYAWDCTNDGTVDASAATPTGSTCTYPNNGSYTLRLNVTDTVNATGTVTAQVTVANVAPIYTPASNQSTFAASAKLFAFGSFTDPGAEGSWPVAIDWGDNSTSTEFVVSATGSLPNKSHTYATAGTYNVLLTVSDGEATDDGGFQVVVNPPPPGTPTVTPPAEQTATVGTEQPFVLGSFADPGSSGPWQVSVDWGDGSAATQFNASTPGVLSAKLHTFAAANAYDVVVTVSDGVLSASASFGITASVGSSDAGSVTGIVFADANANGAQEADELGVAGAETRLETAGQVSAAGVALTRTTTSDSNGRYRFDNVPPDDYTLTITPPTGYATLGAAQAPISVKIGETTTAQTFTLQLGENGTLFLPAVQRP